jgi:hypothetical protein
MHMTARDILHIRLVNQRLIGKKFSNPAEAVRWFGAVQSQDYPGAKWAVGQRVANASDETLEDAFTKGEILRTHVMRPTWHFVHPQDIRWMLMLTGPRVSKMMSSYNKKLELTPEVFSKAQKVIIKVLQGKKALTRQELKAELVRIGITTNVQRLAHIIMQAELDAVVCNGPRRGKQFTYMLLEERVPKTKSLSRDEALAELTRRYFTSHGPATIHDYAWWSGVSMIDAGKGIELNTHLQREEVEGKVYFFSNNPKIPNTSHSATFLLPNYDEFGIAYKNREIFIPEVEYKKPQPLGALLFPHMIVRDGALAGMWKRIFKTTSIIIEPQFFTKPTGDEYRSYEETASRYGKFLNLPVTLLPHRNR